MSHPAVEAFEKLYAERSGVSVSFLHSHGRFGSWCGHDSDGQGHCSDPERAGCEGFEMLHLWDEMVEAGWTPSPTTGRGIDLERRFLVRSLSGVWHVASGWTGARFTAGSFPRALTICGRNIRVGKIDDPTDICADDGRERFCEECVRKVDA